MFFFHLPLIKNLLLFADGSAIDGERDGERDGDRRREKARKQYSPMRRN